jgi:hypothetical protein
MVRPRLFCTNIVRMTMFNPTGLGESSRTYASKSLARFMLKMGKADCPNN